MSEHAEKVMEALINAEQWQTINDLSKATGIAVNHVYKVFHRPEFKYIERKRIPVGEKKAMAYKISADRIYRPVTAVELARKHNSWVGQLEWATHG